MAEVSDYPERAFIEALSSMYSRPEYHYPIVMAQFQYRARYYGLSGAAMLEDLFFDALNHYVHTHLTAAILERPPRGERGYDYSFDGVPISHKVSKSGPLEIAALWDATKTHVTTWNFPTSICFTTGGYASSSFKAAVTNGGDVRCTPLQKIGIDRNPLTAALVHWPAAGYLRILDIWTSPSLMTESPRDVLAWNTAWGAASSANSRGLPANELEIVGLSGPHVRDLSPGSVLVPSDGVFRPGVYLLAKDWLQGVPVKANNRALLLKRDAVKTMMVRSQSEGLHIPLSDWFSVYVSNTPPDLYLAQKSEYDLYFSGYGLRRMIGSKE